MLDHAAQIAGWRQMRRELATVFILDPEVSERMQAKLTAFLDSLSQQEKELAESRLEVEALLELVKELSPHD